jgi:hypothetical protein
MGFAEVPQTPRTDRLINKPMNEALDKDVAKFTANGTPLKRALESLAKDAHLDMVVNWDALAKEEVKPDAPVSMDLAQMPARKVLKNILDQVGQNGMLPRFLVHENRVIVSSAEDLSSTKYQAVIVYDLRPVFADLEYDSSQANEIATNIIDSMKSVVDEDSWKDNGGAVGSARILAGQLIINQTLETHDKIAEFLKLMTEGTPRNTRSYDVRDLVKEDAAVPAATMPAGGSNKVQLLIEAIQANCGRDTWRDRGGRTSSIAYFEGKLYITTRPAIHDQIERLLTLMRK